MDSWFPINCRCKLEGFVSQHSCLWNQHPLSPLSIKCKCTLNNCVNHEKGDFLILMRDIWITVWTGSQRMFAHLSSLISFLLLCLALQFEQILEVAATVIPTLSSCRKASLWEQKHDSELENSNSQCNSTQWEWKNRSTWLSLLLTYSMALGEEALHQKQQYSQPFIGLERVCMMM